MVTSWHATVLLDGRANVVRSLRAPTDPDALAERVRRRREGRRTPEEEELLSGRGKEAWTTRDRRLTEGGVQWDPRAPGPGAGPPAGPELASLREAILRDADRSLEAAWDPSVHVQEGVRAVADLDRVRNLLGERLGSWVSRDFPDLDAGDHARAVTAALERGEGRRMGPPDPMLRDARRTLAELYRSVEAARADLETAVNASVPGRTPNLVSLLGPELSARLLASAGGLERLARLPASTIQVLGAERAFFEHLRGHAPPPRHGLLFLHPSLQSAGRVERGRLARALAGKVAIAARLDHEGTPVNPELVRAFERRRDDLRARRGRPPGRARRGGSRPPLHRAAEDR